MESNGLICTGPLVIVMNMGYVHCFIVQLDPLTQYA